MDDERKRVFQSQRTGGIGMGRDGGHNELPGTPPGMPPTSVPPRRQELGQSSHGIDPKQVEEARVIRELHTNHGVPKEFIAQLKQYGFSLSSVLRRLESGDDLFSIEDEVAAYEDAENEVQGKASKPRQRDQVRSEESRLRVRVAELEDIMGRHQKIYALKKGQYKQINWYNHLRSIVVHGGVLIFIAGMLLVDWYFSVAMFEKSRLFPDSGMPFALSSQTVLSIFSRWLVLIPIISTLSQAQYFPLAFTARRPWIKIQDDLSVQGYVLGGGTLLINWVTSLAGVGILLWASWIGDLTIWVIPIGKVIAIFLTPIIAFALSTGPEWMFQHFFPLFLLSVWGFIREIHHNIWTFFVIESPRQKVQLILVNITFIVVCYAWMMYVPGFWLFPSHGLTRNAFILYGVGIAISIFLAALVGYWLSDRPDGFREKSSRGEMEMSQRGQR